MLLLLFHAGSALFGVEASRIVEVVSAPSLRMTPHAGASVAGLFNYRGTIVPVIDLSVLLTGTPARRLLSTRVVVVDWRAANGATYPLGLLVEKATEAITCRKEEFQPAGIQAPEAPYAGEILIRPEGMIQKLELEKLIPLELQDQLFTGMRAEL